MKCNVSVRHLIAASKGAMIAVAMMLVAPQQTAADWKMANVAIKSRFAADVSPTNALPEYPRPQMVRPDWQNLNGLWDFTYLPTYETEIPKSDFQQILVPYCVESALSGIKTHYESMAYRRNFSVPAAWSGKRVLLNFEAVDWRCTVYINGEQVGSHDGGYDPFTFDITDKVKVGAENEVAVKVYDPTDRWSVPRGKQVRNPGGIFYTACSGIWQTVWLEAVNKAYIQDFRLTPDIDAETLTVNAVAGGDIDNVQKIKATAYHGSQKVAEGEGQSGQDIVLSIANPDLWNPDHPFLYDLKLELTDKSGGKDEVESYFGMRKIHIEQDKDGFWRMMLNNEFVFQSGPLDQGYWPESNLTPPTDEAMQYDIVQTKKYGFNMTRKHLTVEPRRWYYWTDKLGLLVWQDMPSMNYGGSKDAGVGNDANMFTPELTALVNTHYNSPSIINWVIFNEAGGQHDTQKYVNLVRSLDKTRLIDEASGWTHYGYGDIHDVHPYPAPTAPTTTRQQATADGEYGGVKYAIDGHLWQGNGWGYASVSSANEFDSTLCNYFGKLAYYKTYRGLSAAVYTQLTDVEIEVNGLMTYDREVKTDIGRLYKANRKLIEHEGVEETFILSPANIAPQSWRYTTSTPATGWNKEDFDDSGWRTGNSGFGANGLANMTYGTSWTSSDIWLRKVVNLALSEEEMAKLQMILYNDEDVEVYFNGTLAYSATGYLTDYKTVALSAAARKALKRNGENLIAIHVKQTAGGQYIDLGLQVAKDAEERPIERVVQINMDYTKSSELSFAVGYSLDPDATEPEVVKQFTRLTFAEGEANYIGLNDGALLSPKTIQFDITDLVGEIADGTKIKYFVYAKPQTAGEGEGTVYSCVVVDYTHNAEGELTPLTLEPIEVSHETGTVLLSATAMAEAYNAPRNATISGDNMLQWDAPVASTAKLQNYKVLANGVEEAVLPKSEASYRIANPNMAYSVVAMYSTGDSKPSNEARVYYAVEKTANAARHFVDNGFSIPGVFSAPQSDVTIEYWFKPDVLTANSHQVGPGWGTFLIHYDQSARITAGFENSSTKRVQSSANTIKLNEWNHIAVTLVGSRINLYVNGAYLRTMNVGGYSGLPAISEFVFGSNNAYINGWIDDVRIWKKARTAAEIQEDMNAELVNPSTETDLLAYYKMDEINDNGVKKLRDAAHGHHATYLRSEPTTLETDTTILNGSLAPMNVALVVNDSAVVVGQEITAKAIINSSVVSWKWDETSTKLHKQNLETVSIVFPKAGDYKLSLTAYDIDGNSIVICDTISVKAASLPTVEFDIYQPDKAAGEPITLYNKSEGVATNYKWTIPGSLLEQTQTSYNASAIFPDDGTYTITLTATNATGSVSLSKEIEINSGNNNMTFRVAPNVVLPYETVELITTDEKASENLVWTISNDKNRILILGGTTTFSPKAVGRYDISFTDSENGISSHLHDALYVCSANSRTGLYFRNRAEALILPTPFTERTTKFTVEWWMKPSILLNAGAMRTNNEAFSLSTDANGVMTANVNGKAVSSPEGFVIADEWHHYAVVLTGSHLYLLRDGEEMASYSPVLTSPAWDELIIGGENSPMSANIDELRIWGSGLRGDALLAVCNNPIENVAEAESKNSLFAYYKFDDLSTIVKDETSNKLNGKLSGFQQIIGTNYVKSDGVFSLSINTPSAIENEVDITADYLTNYKAAFRHTATDVDTAHPGSHFALENGTAASTWKGDILPTEDAGVYVDAQNGNKLAFTTSWGDFADNASDRSIYETVILPAGVYRFEAISDDTDNTDDCLLVASLGSKLAELSDITTTLASAPLNNGSVTFTVPRETEVSLGVLYNLPAYSNSLISGFSLVKLPCEVLIANPDDVTGVTEVEGAEDISITTRRNGLELRGDNVPVRIYTLDGRLVMGLTVKGSASVALPAGIYIVNNRKVQVK